MKNINLKNNSGYVMLLITIIFMMVSVVIILGLSTPTLQQIFSSRDVWSAKQSYYLSEAGAEDVVYRLKDSTMSTNVGTTETLSLNGYDAITTSTTTVSGKTITTLSNQNGYKKNIETKLTQGLGVTFNYGIFAGNGGFTMTGGSEVIGNIYSNGDIIGSAGVQITGSAIAASGSKILGNGGDYLYIGSTSTDMAWAKDVSNVNVTGSLYCLTGSDNANGKVCDTTHGIPESVSTQVTDDNINKWKSEALSGGTYSGDFSVDSKDDVIGQRKINGNLSVKVNGTLMVTGTLWVTGNIDLTGGGQIKLSPSLGKNSSIIVTDGYVNINGDNSRLEGSGITGSYPIVVSTSVCSSENHCKNNNSAISLSGGAGSVVLVAPYGDVNINGNSSVHSVVGRSISLSGGATITYDSGLANPSFSGGPSGGWVISGWKELEN